MDILDIDSILKDDTFCFGEEKMLCDDVTNIIQQWRINSKQEASFDSRTYTRGKRRLIPNTESSFHLHNNASTSNIRMQIGGLVSQNHKSYLGDTSPPNSISCSIGFAGDHHMLDSLITSADFSNVSFLNANSLEEDVSETTVVRRHISDLDSYLEKNDTFIKFADNSNKNNTAISSNLTNNINDQNFHNKKLDTNLTFQLSTDNNKTQNNNLNGTFISKPLESNSKELSTFVFSKEEEEEESSFLDHAAYIKLENDSKEFFDKKNSIINDPNYINSTFVQKQLTATNEKIIIDNLGTPENTEKNSMNNHSVVHSTPIIKNIISEINLSPISTVKPQQQSNKDNIFQRTFSKEDDLEAFENIENIENFSTELHSFERNENSINLLINNTYNIEENIKMKNALETIKKKRLSNAPKSNVLCDFTSNSGGGGSSNSPSHHSVERLLNKRGRINETVETPKSPNIRPSTEKNSDNVETLNESLNRLSFKKKTSSCKEEEEEEDCPPTYVNHEKNHVTLVKTCMKNENQIVIESTNVKHRSALDSNSKLVHKNDNSSIHLVNNRTTKARPTELPTYFPRTEISKLKRDSIYSESMSRAASASDLDSPLSTQNENIIFKKPVLKSPMGTKSKSFHNLSVNNFGFARKIPENNVITKTQQLRNVQVQSNEKSSNMKSISNSSQNLPTAINSKRSGLIRPSTGIYSQTSRIDMMNHKPDQHLSHDYLKASNLDGLASKCHIDATEKSQSANELESRSKLKMIRDIKEVKFRPPSGLKAPLNIKRNTMYAPSSLYKN